MGRDEIKEERTAVYGDPREAHTVIGLMWTAIMRASAPDSYIDGDPISPKTVALMMAGLKLVRAARPYKRDEDAYDYALNYIEYAREFDGRDI